MGSENCENSQSRKQNISCAKKYNCEINTPFNFCKYALLPCLPSNTKGLP